MEVILREDVSNLGNRGDVVKGRRMDMAAIFFFRKTGNGSHTSQQGG